MIYDCFTFFNELDLLEIRLNELDAVVDKFVLVEATLTHQGKPKPLHYELNKERFARFHHKLVHVVVDNYPPNDGSDAWVFEKHQRNMIKAGLTECGPDDRIMVSDVDEVHRASAVHLAAGRTGIQLFRQRMFYYYLNCRNSTTQADGTYAWHGAYMVRYGDINGPLQELRDLARYMSNHFHPKPLNRLYWRIRLGWHNWRKGLKTRFIDDGGWHFSYLGGVARIIEKIEAFAHTEYNNADHKDAERIKAAMEKGEDIFGRAFKYHIVELDATFPAHVLANRARYAHLIVQVQAA